MVYFGFSGFLAFLIIAFGLINLIAYFKVMRNLKVVNIKGYWIPAKISMYNIKKSHKTIMEMSNIKVDARISEKLFTKRNLRRPA